MKEAEKEVPLKKISESERKLLDELEIGKNPEVIRNPFSGEGVLLEPKAVALHDFIKGSEYLISLGQRNKVREFEIALELFRKLYPESYYVLLD